MTEFAYITFYPCSKNNICQYSSVILNSDWIVAKEIKSFLFKLAKATGIRKKITFIGTIIDGVFYIEKIRDIESHLIDNSLKFVNITYNAIGGSRFVKIGGIRRVSCFDDIW